MTIIEIRPCPNLEFTNHGYCDKCNSRHVRKGYLSYCAFHTILPMLQQAIAESPESETAVMLNKKITSQLKAYDTLRKKYDISKGHQDELLDKVSQYSNH